MAVANKMRLSAPRDVDIAIEAVLSRASFAAGSEQVPLSEAAGRVLAEPVLADRDQPPFNRAAMDGIAVRGVALERGIRTFRCIGTVAAGAVPRFSTVSATDECCVEIMTGAAVPSRFDTVIRYEDLIRHASPTFELEAGYYAPGGNIHHRGTDYAGGDILVQPGMRIDSGTVAVLASCGYGSVHVRTLPRIGILGTGDELVPVSGTPLAHQIRASNPSTIAAELGAWGCSPALSAIVGDDRTRLTEAVATMLETSDVLLVSGAVSKGTFDIVPDVLRDLGVDTVVHGVRQRPGKPLLVGGAGGTLVLGLPGNPVSSLVSVRRYLVPAIFSEVRQARGFPVRLTEALEFSKPLTWFPTLRVGAGPNGLQAAVVAGNGSGDFSHLVGSSGIGVVDEGITRIEAGDPVHFYPWGGF